MQLANINSVEDAGYRDMAWLIENLPKARSARPEAAGFMEAALAGKTVTVTVTPRKTASSETSLTTKLNVNVTPGAMERSPSAVLAPESVRSFQSVPCRPEVASETYGKAP